MSVSGTQEEGTAHTPYYELLLAAWLWCVRGRAFLVMERKEESPSAGNLVSSYPTTDSHTLLRVAFGSMLVVCSRSGLCAGDLISS